MNLHALWSGVLAVFFGAMAYVLVMVKGRRWGGVGVVALGAALLINNLTPDTISPTWHTIRFLVSCVLVAVFVLSFVMDSRARRGGRSRGVLD